MLKTIVEKSYLRINGVIVLTAFIIFMLFILFVLPNEAERSEKYYGDTPAPDSSLIYIGEDLYRMAEGFGAEGRAYYIRSRFTFDVIWPLAYGFFLWASIAYFGRALKHQIPRYVVLLPIIGVILDYLENTGASLVMFLYPERMPVIPSLVPLFTTSKWLIIGAGFLGLMALIVYRGVIVLSGKSDH